MTYPERTNTTAENDISLQEQTDEILFRCLISKTSPAGTVQAVYELLGLPIIAFDPSFRLIAYAFPRPFYYDPWEEIASQGFLSDEFIQGNNSLLTQEQMYRSGRSSYFHEGPASGYPQVCGPILHADELLGYVGICVSEASQIGDLIRINDRLAQTLSIQLTDSDKNRLLAARTSDIEQSIRSGKLSDSGIRMISDNYSPPYCIAVVLPTLGEAPTLYYVKSRIEHNRFSVSAFVEHGRQLVLLFSRLSSGIDGTRSVCAFLEEFAGQYHLCGGVSDLFDDPSRIPAAKLQAEIAMASGRQEAAAIRSFRDAYPTILLQSALERFGPVTSQSGIIMKLAEIDRQEGTAYLPTLQALFDSDGSREIMAQLMGVHKNTIAYRLNRLGEVTGVDLSDPDLIMHLKLGLLVYRFSQINAALLSEGDRIC